MCMSFRSEFLPVGTCTHIRRSCPQLGQAEIEGPSNQSFMTKDLSLLPNYETRLFALSAVLLTARNERP